MKSFIERLQNYFYQKIKKNKKYYKKLITSNQEYTNLTLFAHS